MKATFKNYINNNSKVEKKKKKEPGSELFAHLAEPPKEAGGNVSWEQTFLEASSTSISLDKPAQIYFHNQGNDDKKKWKWQPLNLKQKQCL